MALTDYVQRKAGVGLIDIADTEIMAWLEKTKKTRTPNNGKAHVASITASAVSGVR